MESLEQKFSYLDDFIRSFKSFSIIYEEKKNDGISFESIFKRLNLIEKFIFTISQELDMEKVDKLSEKCDSDREFLIKMINKSIDKTDKVFNPIEAFLNDSSSDSSSEDSDEDKSSESSIDDINSKDSDSTESEENDEELEKERNELNKMIAKSILEFNMRREMKDFGVEKKEEDNDDEEEKKEEK